MLFNRSDLSDAVPLWLVEVKSVGSLIVGLVFVVLATANAAGYRYGVSDQAFYIPVLSRALDPSAFPRDAALIDAQGQLILTDEVLASVVRLVDLPFDVLFLGGYIVSLVVVWASLTLIAARVYENRWLAVALLAAFSLRHRIPRTSANSFEPYFHPRMLAFGIGMLAVAALLRRRDWLAVLLTGVSGLVHVTTGLWFAVLIGVALAVLDRAWRRLALVLAVAVTGIGAWAVTVGPLRASFHRMDDDWLRAVATKDSLFATEWPPWAWVANLGLLGLLWWAHRRRSARGRASAQDAALVWGATALVAVFVVTLPAVAAGLALPVQLQISRVFWLVDIVATVYVLGAIADTAPGRQDVGLALVVVLVAISVARGAYIMYVEQPDRALFAVRLPESQWESAMRWISRQKKDAHVLADPGHAWKYGTSVRVSAARDVFLEEVKDSAIAIYSRDVAVRVVERTAAIGDFSALTAARSLELASRYDLHLLITEADLALPLAYGNERFRIYALK